MSGCKEAREEASDVAAPGHEDDCGHGYIAGCPTCFENDGWLPPTKAADKDATIARLERELAAEPFQALREIRGDTSDRELTDRLVEVQGYLRLGIDERTERLERELAEAEQTADYFEARCNEHWLKLSKTEARVRELEAGTGTTVSGNVFQAMAKERDSLRSEVQALRAALEQTGCEKPYGLHCSDRAFRPANREFLCVVCAALFTKEKP